MAYAMIAPVVSPSAPATMTIQSVSDRVAEKPPNDMITSLGSGTNPVACKSMPPKMPA
jgi:hypothetical protein